MITGYNTLFRLHPTLGNVACNLLILVTGEEVPSCIENLTAILSQRFYHQHVSPEMFALSVVTNVDGTMKYPYRNVFDLGNRPGLVANGYS